MFGSRVLRSQTCQAHLKQFSRFEHFIRRELMKIGKDPQRFAVERRRTFSNISSRAVSRSEHTNGAEESQTVSQTRATDTQSLGQFALRWKSIARLETALTNHVANLRNDLFGDQSGFFWSDHPEAAKTNCAVLVPSHRLDNSLPPEAPADKAARIVAHFHCVTRPVRGVEISMWEA